MSRRGRRFDEDGNEIDRSDELEHFGEDEGEVDDMDLAQQIKDVMPYADDLTHKSLIKKQQADALSDIAPFVRLQPPSVMKGTLGGQDTVTADPSTTGAISNNFSQVALWGGDDAETTPITITLGVVQQFTQSKQLTAGKLRPYGIVQFGTRGFLDKVEVDIVAGCQFTISASHVSVQVALETIPGGGGGTMQLLGMISFFPIVRTTPLTRTQYIDALPDGTQVTNIIPAYAKGLRVWGLSGTAAVEFLDSTGTVIYGLLLAAAQSMFDAVPFSGDVVAVRFTNTAGFNLNHIRLIYDLAL